jgi:hypothetical protein
MKPDCPGTMTPDYKRHDTTDLFGTMSPSASEVLRNTRHSHKATDVLTLVELIDLGARRHLAIDVTLDNLPRCNTKHTPTSVPHQRHALWASALHPNICLLAEPPRPAALPSPRTSAASRHLQLGARPSPRHHRMPGILEC